MDYDIKEAGKLVETWENSCWVGNRYSLWQNLVKKVMNKKMFQDLDIEMFHMYVGEHSLTELVKKLL